MFFEVYRRSIGVWRNRFLRPGRRSFHPTLGKGMLVAPDGTVLWEGDWEVNALHDEGEASIINVWLREQSHPSKYGFLMNEGNVTPLADTVGMGDITESETPGTHGYARQQYLAANWGAPALDSGDMQSEAASKTYGPNSDSGAWTVSHVGLTSASTGTSGDLFVSVPLSAEQNVTENISFVHTFKGKVK